MMNLLRGEFYKLYKSKAFYVCCLVSVLSAVFIYGMLALADSVQRGEVANGTGGVYVGVSNGSGEMELTEHPILEEIGLLEGLQQMFGNFASFTIAIFAAIFVIGEYNTGAVKNVVGKGYARARIFLAKYIATMAAGLILLILTAAATVLIGAVVMHSAGVAQDWSRAFWGNLFRYCGIQLLLEAAIVGVIVTLSEVCRNLAAGISISVALLGFSTLLTSGLDLLVRYLLPQSKLRIADYWLVDLIMDCPLQGMDKGFVVHTVLVCMAWLVLTVAVGIAHFRRADIK